jgi:hypothetical protein
MNLCYLFVRIKGYLKDRRERTVSYDDIKHYQKITVALGETIRLMKSPCLFELLDA